MPLRIELENGQIQSVDVQRSQSIVAVVGDNMAGSPGIAARFFGNLSRRSESIFAPLRRVRQSATSLQLFAPRMSTKALRAAHSGSITCLPKRSLSALSVRAPSVARCWTRSISNASDCCSEFNLDIRIRAIARSRKMYLGDRRIDLSDWRRSSKAKAVDLDLDEFEAHVNADHIPHAVIIDCTASDRHCRPVRRLACQERYPRHHAEQESL